MDQKTKIFGYDVINKTGRTLYFGSFRDTDRNLVMLIGDIVPETIAQKFPKVFKSSLPDGKTMHIKSEHPHLAFVSMATMVRLDGTIHITEDANELIITLAISN